MFKLAIIMHPLIFKNPAWTIDRGVFYNRLVFPNRDLLILNNLGVHIIGAVLRACFINIGGVGDKLVF